MVCCQERTFVEANARFAKRAVETLDLPDFFAPRVPLRERGLSKKDRLHGGAGLNVTVLLG